MIRKFVNRIRYSIEKYNYREENDIARNLIQNKQKPVYHVHIRKTAGTTINFAFLSNSGSDNIDDLYNSLSDKPNHRIIDNEKVYVGWNVQLINEGNYSFAFSHTPLHQLDLRPDTFVFTCLRDPVKRLLSHYNMLRYYQINKVNHSCMKTEGKWLGNNFNDFIVNVPKEHLLNQIYMYSKEFSTEEAFENLMSIDKIIFTEDLANGLKDLESMTGMTLPISNKKKYGYKEDLNDSQLSLLREKMAPEYELFEMLNKELK